MVGVKPVNEVSQKQVRKSSKEDQMLPAEQVKYSLHLLVIGDVHCWRWQEQFQGIGNGKS